MQDYFYYSTGILRKVLNILLYLIIQIISILKKNILLFVFVLILHLSSTAQKKQNQVSAFTRCFTMERVQQYLHANPTAKLPGLQSLFKTATKNTANLRGTGIEDIISIPVIFHIVLPNPYTITDAVVQSQINELNLAFSGLNADSTNAVNFYSVRGHSAKIRFVAAKRTPSGALSNGIDRIKSSAASNANLAIDPIKRTSLGGADVWDPASYLNFWVSNDVSGKHVLGYAQFPGTGFSADDGIFCNQQSFGISSCNINNYNKGRTIVHEVGHYFGLYHIWGDEDECSGDDFRSLSESGSSVALPANLFNMSGQGNTGTDIGDTPNQGANTTSCLSGTVTDGCTSIGPGKMYQNYMDYTPDNCYSLFTNKQVERMEWIVDNQRSGFKSSLGGTAPAGAIRLDVSPYESVNPGGIEAIGCSSFEYPSVFACPGSIVPKIRIKNNGTQPVKSVTVGLKINGVDQLPVTISIAGAGLAFGETKVVSFPLINILNGTYNFKFYTYNVNGAGNDLVTSNDTLTSTLSIVNGSSLPVFEGFESLPFPSLKWSLYNPDGDATWTKFNSGSNSSSSMFIDNFSKNNTGLFDELRTPKFLLPTTDSVIISFDLAHKNYPGLNDQLSLLVSNDCGTTWTTVYSKSGNELATAGSTTLGYLSPNAGDWKNQKITIGGGLVSTGQIVVAIRNTGNYGNNIFIDNINIYKQNNRDISASAIITPNGFECSNNISVPQIEVSNNGLKAVTRFKVGYIINNENTVYKQFAQTLAPGAKITVTLAPLAVVKDTNTFKVFTADPESATGMGDENNINDTLGKNFILNKNVEAPLTEGFENNTFPPSNWVIINGGVTKAWVKKSPGNNSGFAAFIDNFSENNYGQIDILKTPAINISGAAGAIITFDLAHKNYPGFNDELVVKVSTDCGNTFSVVYNKAGESLATAGSSGIPYTRPLPGDWKTQSIILDAAFAAGGTIIIAFENISDNGNNVFLDNIHISKLYKRDLKLVTVKQPVSVNCSTGPIEPIVTVANNGIDTVTAFNISYTLDNGPVVTKVITGILLPRDKQIDIKLNTLNGSVGSHTFTVFTFEPVTLSGTGDQNTFNDSLRMVFVIVGLQATLPLVEDFESTNFPPLNWGIVVNPDSETGWLRSTAAAIKGVASMEINNFTSSVSNATNKFISPVISNSNKNDSVFVSFDLAYKQGSTYPGSTVFPLDTLEVQVTKDCGVTYNTVWKKWGENLQTVNDPNSPVLASFIPQKNNWKNIQIYLSPFVTKDNFQVYLVAKSNKQNNIWIDNINVYAKILPLKLKEQGYLIYPNPFNNNFLIHHYGTPVNLKAVEVYNSTGQLVWDKRYNGNAPTEITVDIAKYAGGAYMLKLFYTNKTIQQKIVKQ